MVRGLLKVALRGMIKKSVKEMIHSIGILMTNTTEVEPKSDRMEKEKINPMELRQLVPKLLDSLIKGQEIKEKQMRRTTTFKRRVQK
ncbi:unnamed protein product [Calypogeia fissa]